MENSITPDNIDAIVREAVHGALVVDVALAHLRAAGVDALLTTPELVHETKGLQQGRGGASLDGLPPAELASRVWSELFVHRTPVSEPCRRVLTLFNKLGFRDQVQTRNLAEIRKQVAELGHDEWEKRVYQLLHMQSRIQVVSTEDAPSDVPIAYGLVVGPSWETAIDAHVAAASGALHHLRVDVTAAMSGDTLTALAQKAVQLQCALWLIVSPACQVPQLPADLRLWVSGASPRMDITDILHIYPQATLINVGGVSVAAYDATRRALERLGTRFVAHASLGMPCLEHAASAWYHAKSMIGRTLSEKYRCLLYAGWSLAISDITHDVEQLVGGSAMVTPAGALASSDPQ